MTLVALRLSLAVGKVSDFCTAAIVPTGKEPQIPIEQGGRWASVALGALARRNRIFCIRHETQITHLPSHCTSVSLSGCHISLYILN